MSQALEFFGPYFPVTLPFSMANPAAGATNVLKLAQGNGFIVPRDYVFHPLLLTAKSNGALTEMMVNGGFETAGGGTPDIFGTWVEAAGNGAIAQEAGAGNFHGGAKSCKLTTGADGLVKVTQTFVSIPGYHYNFSYWVKGDGAVHKVRHQIVDNTHSADILPLAAAVYTPTAQFQNIIVSFEAPAACLEIAMVIAGDAIEGSICYVDDVSVYPSQIHVPTAVFKIATDGTAPSEGLSTFMDDIVRENEDDAHVGFYPIAAGSEVTIQMITTANYVPVTADVDVVLLGVLKHV